MRWRGWGDGDGSFSLKIFRYCGLFVLSHHNFMILLPLRPCFLSISRPGERQKKARKLKIFLTHKKSSDNNRRGFVDEECFPDFSRQIDVELPSHFYHLLNDPRAPAQQISAFTSISNSPFKCSGPTAGHYNEMIILLLSSHPHNEDGKKQTLQMGEGDHFHFWNYSFHSAIFLSSFSINAT